MAGFIVPLFLAALLVVIFRPLHNWCLSKFHRRPKTAAFVTTALIMLIVLLPFTLLSILAVAEGRTILRQLEPQSFGQKIEQLRNSLNLDMPAAEPFEDVQLKIKKVDFPIDPNPAEIEMHAVQLTINLDDFKRASRRVGNALNLTWLDEFDTEASDNETRPGIGGMILQTASADQLWAEFNRNMLAAEKTLKSVDWKAAAAEGTNDQRFYECQQAVRATVRAYEDFKNKYLGGRAWALLRELANPDKQELDTYLENGFSFVRDKMLSYGGATTAFIARTLFGMAIMIIALYFFLLDGPSMLGAVKRLSPLDDDHEDQLIQEFDKVSRAVVVATLLSAIVQGVLAGIGFYFAGLDSIFLLMMLTTILALIPFVGAAAVWVPVCLYLYFFDGRLVAALVLAVYGAGIISMADNVIKPLVLHGQSNLHPLWALLSVLGGVTALGPIGILVGPMVVAFLQTMLKILAQELSTMESSEAASSDTS